MRNREVEDREAIKITVDKTVNSIRALILNEGRDQLNNNILYNLLDNVTRQLTIVVNAATRIAYSHGYCTGYDEGIYDGKNGVDKRTRDVHLN